MSAAGDFFTFCTSLAPLELKALGELSEVRHLGAAQTIYLAGDISETLYIISRGMVVTVPENATVGVGTYLSRGDIFGDLEVLSDLPRTHLARSCDNVSLRVFHRRDFDGLRRRVPSFFFYLSQRLARRLVQTREAPAANSHCRELSGSLAQFDLVTIYQTITSSAQSGELSIRDEHGEKLAEFWFGNGEPRAGFFEHLSGEEAFAQLFLAQDLNGNFAFDSAAAPPATYGARAIAMRNPQEMLIGAVQQRDELTEIKTRFLDAREKYGRATLHLDLTRISDELWATAQKLWKLALPRPLTIEAMYRDCDVCELKIYRAAAELLRTGHFEYLPQLSTQLVA